MWDYIATYKDKSIWVPRGTSEDFSYKELAFNYEDNCNNWGDEGTEGDDKVILPGEFT